MKCRDPLPLIRNTEFIRQFWYAKKIGAPVIDVFDQDEIDHTAVAESKIRTDGSYPLCDGIWHLYSAFMQMWGGKWYKSASECPNREKPEPKKENDDSVALTD